jgi:hypothetical protein
MMIKMFLSSRFKSMVSNYPFHIYQNVPFSLMAFMLSSLFSTLFGSVADPDPDPPDPHVLGPPGSGSTSQRYRSGSFYHHAKIVRKTLIPTIM